MKILITNDDGIKSTGLVAARNAVKDIAETTVVAPIEQQSGVGHGITLVEPLRAFPDNLHDGSEGFSVKGTPTDALVLGVKALMDEEPDLVISGINLGENLSESITTSGTLGAALEAAGLGIPAIAVSLQLRHEELKFKDGVVDVDWSFAEKVLRSVVERIMDKGMPEGVKLFNLNIPLDPETDVIKQSKLAHRMYTTEVKSIEDPYQMNLYWIVGDEILEEEEGTDVYTLRILNQPSITPISGNLAADVDISKWL